MELRGDPERSPELALPTVRVRYALEAAGVEFIADNDGGVGEISGGETGTTAWE